MQNPGGIHYLSVKRDAGPKPRALVVMARGVRRTVSKQFGQKNSLCRHQTYKPTKDADKQGGETTANRLGSILTSLIRIAIGPGQSELERPDACESALAVPKTTHMIKAIGFEVICRPISLS